MLTPWQREFRRFLLVLLVTLVLIVGGGLLGQIHGG